MIVTAHSKLGRRLVSERAAARFSGATRDAPVRIVDQAGREALNRVSGEL